MSGLMVKDFKFTNQLDFIIQERCRLIKVLTEHPEFKDGIWKWMTPWLEMSDDEHLTRKYCFQSCNRCGKQPNEIFHSVIDSEDQNVDFNLCSDCIRDLYLQIPDFK